ncbi:cysteine hydrolase family protein [Microbacterium abyssi]|uniref:cysteine hydrolase family protein n=1 Tax=Microbacterium abyssi TaxID=2782166 RepID=UPI001888D95E|nr:cysteine hydrolase [Microbacterium sp. A18JL241]
MSNPLPVVVDEAWLVVIDPQNIFASADSAWGSPFFAQAMPRIRSLADAFGERVIVTRWMPTADRSTSWGDYFAAWPFADQPPTDALFDLVPDAAGLSPRATLDLPAFGKWGPELESIVGHGGRIVLAGVSTDCCVLSTALVAADAGAHVTVATDACAGSTAENHAAAVHVMGLYPPQITLATTAEVLARRRASGR